MRDHTGRYREASAEELLALIGVKDYDIEPIKPWLDLIRSSQKWHGNVFFHLRNTIAGYQNLLEKQFPIKPGTSVRVKQGRVAQYSEHHDGVRYMLSHEVGSLEGYHFNMLYDTWSADVYYHQGYYQDSTTKGYKRAYPGSGSLIMLRPEDIEAATEPLQKHEEPEEPEGVLITVEGLTVEQWAGVLHAQRGHERNLPYAPQSCPTCSEALRMFKKRTPKK